MDFAKRDKTWPAFHAFVEEVLQHRDNATGKWPTRFIVDTLRRGVPNGMLGRSDNLGGMDGRGPIFWWQGIRAFISSPKQCCKLT